MKKIKALALSDLHLGEPEGLLYNSNDKFNLIDIMINKIGELSKGDGVFDSGIERLILMGDIVDLSEASAEEAYENTKVLLSCLLKKVDIDKVVYVPGNHDHHLWVELLKAEYGVTNYKECTPKIKIDLSITKKNFFVKHCLPSDYPDKKVEIRYPNYHLETENAYYLFDHGHLFSEILSKLTSAENAVNLADIEERTYHFMERIWHRKKNKLLEIFYYKPREIFWDNLRRWLLCLGHRQRRTADRGTRFKEDCTPLFDDDLRRKIIWYLEKICGIKKEVEKDFHFIFGHTHYGGRLLRADRKIRLNGRFITVWNTGGWLVPSEIFSPDAYIFYLEQLKDEIHPNLYKLVSREKSEDEGDYPKNILRERVKYVGKV